MELTIMVTIRTIGNQDTINDSEQLAITTALENATENAIYDLGLHGNVDTEYSVARN